MIKTPKNTSFIFGSNTVVLERKLLDLKQEKRKLALLSDHNVMEFLSDQIEKILADLQIDKLFVVEASEGSKSLQNAYNIWEGLLESDFQRGDVLINFGGGVITDLGGFTAANFKRGMKCWHWPTSLMGMIDAAIGAKNAVNFKGIKNQIGNFYPPEIIYLQPDFLKTLPSEELLNGYAEWIKHLLIADPQAWNKWKKEGDPTLIPSENELRANLLIKMDIVAKDPWDSMDRKALNFGHTFGHAIESLSASRGYPIPHGRSIAYGMVLEAWISVMHCGLNKADFKAIYTVIHKIYGPIPEATRNIETLMPLLKKDKKNDSIDGVNFSLLNDIGRPKINCLLTKDDIRKCLETYPA